MEGYSVTLPDGASMAWGAAMNTSWTTFRKRFGKTGQEDEPRAESPARAAAPVASAGSPPGAREPALRPDSTLDAVGQNNELIRVRSANLIDRLEEIRRLKEDFASLTEPVFDLIGSYPQLQSRLLETEAVLRQEQETTATLRRELSALSASHSRVSDDHVSAALSQLRKAESRLREQDSRHRGPAPRRRRTGRRPRRSRDQLAIETERARTIAEENQALRLEAQESDQAVARAERELIELRERNGLLDHEVSACRRSPRSRTTGSPA